MKKKKVASFLPDINIVIPDFVPAYHKLWGICSTIWQNDSVHFSDRDFEPMRPFYLEHFLEVAVLHQYKYISFWYLAPDDNFVMGELLPIEMFVR